MEHFIQLNDVSKSYQVGEQQVHALKNVSLTLKLGEFVAVGGPSGSGKSTLLNICGLLNNCDAGSYHFEAQEINQLNARALTTLRRAHIGFVFQHFNLIPVLNALDNVAYPLMLTDLSEKQRHNQAREILNQVGLEKFTQHLPDKLSGGQRQRVAIARALVKQPKLIIADEPTANLDTTTATQIIDLMRRFCTEQKTTFLIATHDERMLKRCDRVLHMHDGVLQEGSV